MKVLLDTHALLWWVSDDRRLSPKAREAIATGEVFVSVASLWEVEIKRALGRLDLTVDRLVAEVAQTESFELLNVRPSHVVSLADLPMLHRDPFDRMLIAQAKRERLVLLTRDEDIAEYPLEVLW